MNPRGIAPNEVLDDDGDLEQSILYELNGFTVSPEDSSQWSVGVVPVLAYAHLPNATKRRHNHDDGGEPKGYEEIENFDCSF